MAVAFQPVPAKLQIEGLQAWYDDHQVLKGIHLSVKTHSITAVIGPSGCGKSTFIRCLNRMHEVVPGARMSGNIYIDGEDIYRSMTPAQVRRRVGMVFQTPNIFPTLSIFQNVVAGLYLNGIRNHRLLEDKAESCLRQGFGVSK